jgi:pimeloyl-ACP methyl ester carboxylesterase
VPIIRANGLDIHYTAEGIGPPLVLLHGATSSAAEDWAAQRPLFRQAFRLYLPDARGHAGTRWAPDGRSEGDLPDLLVADLLAFVDQMGLSTFHLAGFSLGGMTALRFATRHAGRLRTLLLVGVDVEREPTTSVTLALMDPERVDREEPEWAAQLERRHGPVQGAGAWRTLLTTIAHGVSRRPDVTPDELRDVRVPTLLVGGDRDVFAPPGHVVSLFRQLPDAQLLVVPDCGHQVMVARPALFNEAAGGFYRATSDVAARRAAAGPASASGILRPRTGTARPPHRPAIAPAGVATAGASGGPHGDDSPESGTPHGGGPG